MEVTIIVQTQDVLNKAHLLTCCLSIFTQRDGRLVTHSANERNSSRRLVFVALPALNTGTQVVDSRGNTVILYLVHHDVVVSHHRSEVAKRNAGNRKDWDKEDDMVINNVIVGMIFKDFKV